MTLVELMIALVATGLVLAVVSVIGVRQQRVFSDLANAAALSMQLRDAAAILPLDLRTASARAGDLRAGEARDTSIELRATIAAAVVCDTSARALVLSPAAAGSATLATTAAIDVGDTAWVLAAEDSAAWTPRRVLSVSAGDPGPCGRSGPVLDAATRAAPRIVVALDSTPDGAPDGAPAPLSSMLGAPVRVTRAVRYSLYRAADNQWYAGERDWNAASGRFNTIQPIAGPFSSAAMHGLVFQYLDSAGAPLPTPVADPRRVAAVELTLRGATRTAVRALGPRATIGFTRTDSVALVLALHNAR